MLRYASWTIHYIYILYFYFFMTESALCWKVKGQTFADKEGYSRTLMALKDKMVHFELLQT